jgi:hypothetical protein
MRWLAALLVGLALGASIGLYLGWVQFPVEVPDSPGSALALRYKDEYTLMIALGFQADGDLDGASQRLAIIGAGDPGAHLRSTTERAIANSLSVSDLRALVALAAAYNQLSPAMEPYRDVTGVGS